MTDLKCAAMVLVLLPVEFLVFPAAVEGFVAPGAPLVGLDMAVSADKLVRG